MHLRAVMGPTDGGLRDLPHRISVYARPRTVQISSGLWPLASLLTSTCTCPYGQAWEGRRRRVFRSRVGQEGLARVGQLGPYWREGGTGSLHACDARLRPASWPASRGISPRFNSSAAAATSKRPSAAVLLAGWLTLTCTSTSCVQNALSRGCLTGRPG